MEVLFWIRTPQPEQVQKTVIKGNALITRAAARDLYDWCNMLSEGLFEEQRDLFRKCFLFYMTISADTLNKSFDTSAIDTLDFNKIRRDLFPVG